ncbi:hypothetical protein M885DRAFT_537039 [Pelagophyceae sp. CCMP2097]|nr:hypothetical protein M885DRAFT_537039 [Pelagophyceae sp. CCMP2097]
MPHRASRLDDFIKSLQPRSSMTRNSGSQAGPSSPRTPQRRRRKTPTRRASVKLMDFLELYPAPDSPANLPTTPAPAAPAAPAAAEAAQRAVEAAPRAVDSSRAIDVALESVRVAASPPRERAAVAPLAPPIPPSPTARHRVTLAYPVGAPPRAQNNFDGLVDLFNLAPAEPAKAPRAAPPKDRAARRAADYPCVACGASPAACVSALAAMVSRDHEATVNALAALAGAGLAPDLVHLLAAKIEEAAARNAASHKRLMDLALATPR